MFVKVLGLSVLIPCRTSQVAAQVLSDRSDQISTDSDPSRHGAIGVIVFAEVEQARRAKEPLRKQFSIGSVCDARFKPLTDDAVVRKVSENKEHLCKQLFSERMKRMFGSIGYVVQPPRSVENAARRERQQQSQNQSQRQNQSTTRVRFVDRRSH